MDLRWFQGNGKALVDALGDHLVLTAIAVGVGLVLSFGAALLVVRDRRWYGPLAAASGFLYTIPSLALFAFFVPITGLSVLTAEIGLVSYTLLILLRNIVAGIDGVPPEVREAADGMGYGRLRRFVAVELPLALPVIVAGIRIATVSTVGLVMVTALIGEGGLGRVMLRGFSFQDWTAVYVGAALTVALAVVLDLVLALVERGLTPWARRRAA